jgi:hypothetical protein
MLCKQAMKERMMSPEKHFYIEGSVTPRLHSNCSIYVDGTAGDDFREGIDVELSHWIPNRTEGRYKAGTSTEICFKFLEANPHHLYDLVINNHLDMDGLLSVFVLAYPTVAMQHREVLCDAAKAGDFWSWSTGKALKIFQEVTLLYQDLGRQKVDLQKRYESCFESLLQILEASNNNSEAQSILEHQAALIEQGKIQRHEITPRFVAYFVPKALSKGRGEEFLRVPNFNEPLSERLAFWPQVRNRWDAEKIQLVAIETDNGIHYDLWYPGHIWADTKGLWKPTGLMLPENAGGFQKINWPALSQVIQELNRIEIGPCEWKLFPGISFAGQKNPREFPIVSATLSKDNEQQESQLPLNTAIGCFKELFVS